MSPLGIALHAEDTGREMGRFPLPAHAHERLIAEAHSSAVLTGELPNDGLPLEDARVTLVGEAAASPALEVVIHAGGAVYRKRYGRESICNDAQVLVSRLCRAGTLPPGKYDYVPVSLASQKPGEPAGGGLKMTRFPRSLPPLPRLSLLEAGVPLPLCPHPAVFVPQCEAERLVAQAQATPEIEVGALLVATPFQIAEDVPHRLGIYVRKAVALAEGTVGEALRVRITPAALAAVPVNAARGEFRGGLAHSHPFSAEDEPATRGLALFLSCDDLCFATSFFWRPFQIQLVIDVHESDPEHALGVFCWVEGRLLRVCFRILNEQPAAWEQGL